MEKNSSGFVPDHIKRGNSQLYEILLRNASMEPYIIQNMQDLVTTFKSNCIKNGNHLPSSKRIFNAIVSDRQFDRFGRPIRGIISRDSVRQVIVRKSILDAVDEN